MFSNNCLRVSFVLSLAATPLLAGDPTGVKENIPPISVLKRSSTEDAPSHSPKRQKRTRVRFNEVTSLGEPLKDLWDEGPETIGFPHEEVEKLGGKEGKSLAIYAEITPETANNSEIKEYYSYYDNHEARDERLKEKQERLSQTIRKDETWEWGFNVLSRFWGLETEAHPKSKFIQQDFIILKTIDTALRALLGNIDDETNFNDFFPDLYDDAQDEYIDASTTPDDSKKFPNNRKRFTIARKVFEIFGITKKQFGSPQPQIDLRQFEELFNHIYNQKIDAFEERYTLRSEHAKVVAGLYFLPCLDLIDDEFESESAKVSALATSQNANDSLILSLYTFAKENDLDLRETVSDEDTRTTLETRRLLLITLKMYLLRPISWEEKNHFNKFEPEFFPEKSDDRAEEKESELRASVLGELSKSRDPVFRDLYWKIK